MHQQTVREIPPTWDAFEVEADDLGEIATKVGDALRRDDPEGTFLVTLDSDGIRVDGERIAGLGDWVLIGKGSTYGVRVAGHDHLYDAYEDAT